jgi:hypothetical protein
MLLKSVKALNLTLKSLALAYSPVRVNPLNAGLNPICHLLALLGAHPIFHVSRIRVKVSVIEPSDAVKCRNS